MDCQKLVVPRMTIGRSIPPKIIINSTFHWHFFTTFVPNAINCIWMFPKIVVPQNGWFIMENPINMYDLGGKKPLFLETPILCFGYPDICDRSKLSTEFSIAPSIALIRKVEVGEEEGEEEKDDGRRWVAANHPKKPSRCNMPTFCCWPDSSRITMIHGVIFLGGGEMYPEMNMQIIADTPEMMFFFVVEVLYKLHPPKPSQEFHCRPY